MAILVDDLEQLDARVVDGLLEFSLDNEFLRAVEPLLERLVDDVFHR